MMMTTTRRMARARRPTRTRPSPAIITHDTIMISISLELFIVFVFVYRESQRSSHWDGFYQRTNRLQVLQRNEFDTPGFTIERPNQQHC